MRRTPEVCRYRESLGSESGMEAFCCKLARQIVGPQGNALCEVRRDACEACCNWALLSPRHINPVVASLVYGATGRILKEASGSARQIEEAIRAQQYVIKSLEVLSHVVERDGFRSPRPAGFRDPQVRHRPDQPSRKETRLRWAVGLLTAPRPNPTILRTLRSLEAAGFDSIHVFAEPGSWIPGEFADLPVTVHGQTLGNLGNFYTSLVALYMIQPEADCYALFQDDIEAAQGLREWCDHQFWPNDTGLVSLFTPRAYGSEKAGWQLLTLGLSRTFGAQAFVFRRDILKEFLTDGASLEHRQTRVHGDDAVVGEWAICRGIGIAYHHPSPVQHIGEVSSIPGHRVGRHARAVAVASVDQIASWRSSPQEQGKIGLVGWNTASGLGYQNRDIAVHASIDRWLVPCHRQYPTLSNPPATCRIDRVRLDMDLDHIRSWLDGLDWLLFVELPCINRLPQLARELGISVACVPNWEWTSLELDWVNYVDLMMCPTKYTYKLIGEWKSRFGFAWDVVHVSWPVDTQRFPFRRRERCRRFLFVNGTGGSCGRRSDGSLTPYRRKGSEVLFEAAGMVPHIPLVVYSQADDVPLAPRNVELRKPPRRNVQLYKHGDVCVQPSHWEGLGLQLMECQASGLPLVTTDAPPMNEYQPIRAIPVAETEIVSVCGTHPITANRIDPADLARILEELYETDVSQASERARQFVVREHSWQRALPLLTDRMRK